jgi:phthiocerol/phenolphthiocerol synthesis type-I polyketide synthase E
MDPVDRSDDIAIIGMACRFPRSDNVSQFWENLRDGVELVSFFSDEELLSSGVPTALLNDPNYVRARAALKGVEMFDASFFDIPPREAEIMDPQHRLFLECAWEALENGCYNPEAYKGRIGVFAGDSLNTYALHNLLPNRELLSSVGLYKTMLASDGDYLTTRVSYKLNLRGPSVNVRTACSTSLVAVHMACQSLLGGECEMALAGGVSIHTPQASGYLYEQGMIFSPDGHCRAFDARAQGTVDGSGLGLVVLKLLEDAIEDGDYIHAVIKGSAVNNDGSSKAGFTAPSITGQASVIREALAVARVEASSISFVEAHGTGTSLGDPIEIAALAEAFRAGSNTKGACAIGSVKTNMGHLDAAAGIAGLIKTVLSLKHKQLPPTLHYERPNPEIDFDKTPFYVNTKLTEWKTGRGARRAGVSSFGIGGTNAHVIVEEAPARRPGTQSRPWHLLLLSAKTTSALDAETVNLAEHLNGARELNLADIAYTLQVGRKPFDNRRIVICADISDALSAIEKMDPERVFTRERRRAARPITFMFPGQGSQHVNMGLELYRNEPRFRDEVDTCSKLLEDHLSYDLREALYPGDPHDESAAKKLDQTYITQPAIFVIEYALAKLWMQWGVKPSFMIGHSVGEYVAASMAGVFSLEDALMLVAARGRLMQSLPGGAMLAVGLDEKEVQPLLGAKLSLAAVNGPLQCVIAGPAYAVNELRDNLGQQNIDCRLLRTSHAFHSDMMSAILEPFVGLVREVNISPPKIPFISNVTGTWITDSEATDPNYWAAHLRQPVRFESGLRKILSEPNAMLLEVGPGRALSSLAKRHQLKADEHLICSSLRHTDDMRSDQNFLLKTLGQLWLTGVPVNWQGFYAGETRLRVPLPTYPFERQQYWIEPQRQQVEQNLNSLTHSKNENIADWFYAPIWKQSVPAVGGPEASAHDLCWLVFLDEWGLGQEIVKRLEREAKDVVAVKAGEQFAKLSDGAYSINPNDRDDYDRLLKQLRGLGKAPASILHLWSVTDRGESSTPSEVYERQLDLGFYSLVFLAGSLGETLGAEQARIAIVSTNMQKVAGEAALCPEKAAVLGPCRVIPQEYPNITCRSIDITLPERGSWRWKRLTDQLMLEFALESPEAVVAYRDNSRWVQGFEQVRLNATTLRPVRLREAGVWLITGGLGGIGLEISEHLARTAKAKLVLTSRSAFPVRGEWEQWLAGHDNQDGISTKIRRLIKIESLGAEVLTLSANVSDRAQMEKVVVLAQEKFGQINGVIHAAGVAGGGMIELKTREMMASVLAPKIAGTRVLGDLFKDAKLDLFVLCSSLNSLIGGFGQVDYCAASAYLDAFAHYKSATSDTPTVSIDWDAWVETGMAADTLDLHRPWYSQPAHHKTIRHPLLDKQIAGRPGQEIYLTEFSPQKDWVLDEHRIVGNPVIPGTAYLEMARAALEQQGDNRAIELRDVYFVTPLRVRDGERKDVYTILERDGQGYKFLIRSNTASGKDEKPIWQEHAFGRIVYADLKPTEKYEIDALIERCRVREIITTDLVQEDDGPRWRILKRVYIGNDELVAAIELPDAYQSDLEEFKLHPSLLDVATGVSKQYLAAKSEYLPLSYRRLTLRQPLTKRIYSHARYREEGDPERESVTFDLLISDENGQPLVEIEGFTAKRVNDIDSRIKAWSETESPNAQQDPNLADEESNRKPIGISDGILSVEGREAFGRILSGNLLPQIVVSTKDLQSMIAGSNESARSALLERAEIFARPETRPKHPRPDTETRYVAPRNELEATMAEIWQEMFGIDRVGVQDNFFELGGDSILAIQILGRANEAGLQITPQELFRHQTIAELAAIAETATANLNDQTAVTSPLALTPVQQSILTQTISKAGHTSQAILLGAHKALDPAMLRKVVEHLLVHHDALRLRFEKTPAGWQQFNASPGDDIASKMLDISYLSESESSQAFEEIATALQRGIDPLGGPLIRLALLKSSTGSQDRLLIVAHDLVVDDASWRFLIDDLQTAYQQMSSGEVVQHFGLTTSFKQCLARLTDYTPAQEEIDYWLEALRERGSSLPVDYSHGARLTASQSTLSLSLSATETSELLDAIPASYSARVEEILLAAFSQVLQQWVGSRFVLVDIQSNWRKGILRELDASRTVGQFTSIFPLLLDLEKVSDPKQALRAAREQLRRVPNRGISYGLLRCMKDGAEAVEKLRAAPPAEVCFVYAGDSVESLAIGSFFKTSQRIINSLYQPVGNDPHLLRVIGSIVNGCLQVSWTYREDVYRSSTIERLACSYEQALWSLIAHCKSFELADYAPSDFPLAKLDEEGLGQLAALINEIDQT